MDELDPFSGLENVPSKPSAGAGEGSSADGGDPLASLLGTNETSEEPVRAPSTPLPSESVKPPTQAARTPVHAVKSSPHPPLKAPPSSGNKGKSGSTSPEGKSAILFVCWGQLCIELKHLAFGSLCSVYL